jgi:hypothetical protein
MTRLAQLLRQNWYGLCVDYRSWRDGDFTFREFVTGRRADRQWDPLAPPVLSDKALQMHNDPNRPVFRPDPSRLFAFQPRWDRPDPNPFPFISILPRRKPR